MIQRAISFKYDVPDNIPSASGISCVMGLDPAYSSSDFGICICRYQDEKIQLVWSDEIEHAEHSSMVSKVAELADRFNVDKIYVDGSADQIIHKVFKDRTI